VARVRSGRWRWFLALCGFALVAWLASIGTVLTWALVDDADTADAIIVMGAAQYQGRPSPVLRTRLDHAVSLYQRGVAPRLLLTGGFGTGDTLSEAGVARHYVMSRGVPDAAILMENQGRTSAQSLRTAAEQLRSRGWKTAVLVSDPFHMLRLEILARRYGLQALTSPALPTRAGRTLLRQWGYLLSESFKAPVALLFEW
jgi:uncharacterized SAM-binding protein YcdF (DUF218 family)